VYLHYNSGLHVSINGRAFAGLIEDLLRAWPVPVQELVIIGHSMGGLLARSACHYGKLADTIGCVTSARSSSSVRRTMGPRWNAAATGWMSSSGQPVFCRVRPSREDPQRRHNRPALRQPGG